jgi:hypothetical protein
VLFLLVIDLGVACGAGLYESRVTVPLWFQDVPGGGRHWDAAAARRADPGRRFWVFVTTIPLTLLLVASGLLVWGAPAAVRSWWLLACGAILVERVMTFSYFIPTLLRLMRDERGSGDAMRRARRWAATGAARHALAWIAWLSALRAFTLLVAA